MKEKALTDIQEYILMRYRALWLYDKAKRAENSWAAGRGVILSTPVGMPHADACTLETLVDLANFQATRVADSDDDVFPGWQR